VHSKLEQLVGMLEVFMVLWYYYYYCAPTYCAQFSTLRILHWRISSSSSTCKSPIYQEDILYSNCTLWWWTSKARNM